MFKNVREPKGNVVTIYFEDQPVQAEEGMTVAAAVLNPAEGWTRTSHGGQRRGPFCHMGVCFECLMTIDGIPNRQACLTVVTEGMRVNRQSGAPDMRKEGKSHA